MTSRASSSRAPRVLVTGGSGSVGTALCDGLPGAGWTVRQIDRVRPHDDPDDPHESVVGDVFDTATLDRAIRGCAAVVHLAAIAGEAPIEDIAASHVVGTATVLEAVRRAGVKRFVFTSSNHAVGFTPRAEEVGTDIRPRPDSFYGVGKVAGEALCSLYADRYGDQYGVPPDRDLPGPAGDPPAPVHMAVPRRPGPAGRRVPAGAGPDVRGRLGHLGQHPALVGPRTRLRARLRAAGRRRGLRHRDPCCDTRAGPGRPRGRLPGRGLHPDRPASARTEPEATRSSHGRTGTVLQFPDQGDRRAT